ncbi:vezatin-like [Oculina patagonica]
MADENVVLENSPLQKYLDEIGFTDFEKVKGYEVQDQFEKKRIFSFGTRMEGLFECFNNRTKSWFAITPSTENLEIFSKDYIMAVSESQILNEDDADFLSRFDPELSESRKPRKSREWGSFFSRRYKLILSLFVVLVSVILVTVKDFLFPSLSVVLALLLVTVIESLIQYYFNIHHQRNLGELKLFTMRTKQLVLLLRKCIKLIQEMEIISKGYTMVCPGSSAFFFKNYDNFARSAVYPALRENVVKNTEHVVTCLQKSAKELLLHCPLSQEFAETFTYFSTQSVGNLYEGAGKPESDGYTERMSLQGLKNGTSLIVSLQSEFLSRLLLSLSVKANDGNMYELYFKLFKNLNKILGISSKMMTASLTSVERCYHLHESYCFISEVTVKPPTRPCSKWAVLDTALHSLQLHLQAGILRVQSLQQVMRKHLKSKAEQELEATNLSNVNSNLGVSFQWLKSDLESAFTCWQEGERHLNKMLGKEVPAKELNSYTCDAVNNVNVEESKEPCTLDFKEEVSQIDKVYEAFSDPYEEASFNLPTLMTENLERDINEARKNKQLLQELKAVLLTKDKDPLIDAAGFVQPVKSSVCNLSDLSNVNDDTLHNDNISFITKKDQKEISNASKWNNLYDEKLLSSNEVCNQLPDAETTEHPIEQPTLFMNLQLSVAASAAAAAAAAVTQSQTMGLYQDSFISDDSD